LTAQSEDLKALIARTAREDRAAFRALYDATSPRVYGVLVALLRNDDTAQDVLQDTFVKVWARAGEYHSERGEVLSWIIAIARYRALDLLRASRRRSSYEQQAGESPLLTLPAVSASDEFSLRLTDCLDRLAERQRRNIVAAFVRGFTHEELARQENTPLGTIKSRIRRGLQRLRECLEQ
jgi:RNA polymerase sigma-70 factor (ECF subfamily)